MCVCVCVCVCVCTRVSSHRVKLVDQFGRFAEVHVAPPEVGQRPLHQQAHVLVVLDQLMPQRLLRGEEEGREEEKGKRKEGVGRGGEGRCSSRKEEQLGGCNRKGEGEQGWHGHYYCIGLLPPPTAPASENSLWTKS